MDAACMSFLPQIFGTVKPIGMTLETYNFVR